MKVEQKTIVSLQLLRSDWARDLHDWKEDTTFSECYNPKNKRDYIPGIEELPYPDGFPKSVELDKTTDWGGELPDGTKVLNLTDNDWESLKNDLFGYGDFDAWDQWYYAPSHPAEYHMELPKGHEEHMPITLPFQNYIKEKLDEYKKTITKTEIFEQCIDWYQDVWSMLSKCPDTSVLIVSYINKEGDKNE